jgi:hypothetical protein
MATFNNRFVLINTKDRSYTVYENKVVLAVYIEDETSTLISKDIVEEIRTADYKTKA